MKLAIMQPYFFPYIGYWQLMHSVDCFISLDDVQYIRHGWVNRNRILKPDSGWQYVMVPVHRSGMTGTIREARVDVNHDWRRRILAQIDHYRKLTRHFVSVRALVQAALESTEGNNIGSVNHSLMLFLSKELDIRAELRLSSEMELDYRDVDGADEWALRISQQMGAVSYINPVGGSGIFDSNKYATSGIELQFLKSRDIVYSQNRLTFEPNLSIIDVLMFNGINGTRKLLEEYDLEAACS
jgi:hypothetical protein